MVGGCVLGLGAALLWTGQGRLILDYSDDSNRGELFSIFWSFYRAASVLGGVLSFTYFSVEGSDAGSTKLYVFFLVMILLGAALCSVLRRPDDLERSSQFRMAGEQMSLAERPAATAESWLGEVQAVLRLLCARPMRLLFLLCWCSGSIEPYVLVGFTSRCFDKRTTGAEMVLFFSCAIVSSLLCGQLLDWHGARGEGLRRRGARRCLAVLAVLHIAGFAIGACIELTPSYARGVSISDPEVLLPSCAFALWGASDAAINTYLAWSIGWIYLDGGRRAHATGILKFANSAGHVLSSAMLPRDRVPGWLQLVVQVALFSAGVCSAWWLPPDSLTNELPAMPSVPGPGECLSLQCPHSPEANGPS
eukprot:gnl/TRDRNA2_/TRDRNA2_147978_c0_seq2.p1 gnl/TRDRNA2_/TRDRNA2_147978_c0~~gnl/TRDRNA2_/TRDRNA2_147978_c0_seq2.p1  ORF type:complete len:406 (+),score=27.33 gnl/TRDRNA2_/TRDRNA2_147978_c0_seq2:130-1218(+)